jgi:hypothetical protein
MGAHDRSRLSCRHGVTQVKLAASSVLPEPLYRATCGCGHSAGQRLLQCFSREALAGRLSYPAISTVLPYSIATASRTSGTAAVLDRTRPTSSAHSNAGVKRARRLGKSLPRDRRPRRGSRPPMSRLRQFLLAVKPARRGVSCPERDRRWLSDRRACGRFAAEWPLDVVNNEDVRVSFGRPQLKPELISQCLTK